MTINHLQAIMKLRFIGIHIFIITRFCHTLISYEHSIISNHPPLNCLSNRYSGENQRNHQRTHTITGPYWENWLSISSDNGLAPIRHQAIILTNAGLLSIGPLGTNFSEIWIKICNFSFTKNHLKISSAKWRPFCPGGDELTHWGRVTHICVGTNTNIGSDNGLSPGRRQAIIWTNAGILLIGQLGTNFSVFLIEIHTFSFMKLHLKISSAKWRPFCPGGDELRNMRLKSPGPRLNIKDRLSRYGDSHVKDKTAGRTSYL